MISEFNNLPNMFEIWSCKVVLTFPFFLFSSSYSLTGGSNQYQSRHFGDTLVRHSPSYRRNSRRTCPEDLWARFPCSGCTSCRLDWTRNSDISPRKSKPKSTWGLRSQFNQGECGCHGQQLTRAGCNYQSSWILCQQHFPLSAQKKAIHKAVHGYPMMDEDLQKGQRSREGKGTAWP